MAFYQICDYDNVRRFLTPSIPLREVHLQLGIYLKIHQRQDSDLSCFFRHLAFHYGSTLVTLNVHQWRSAVFPLRRVLEIMPHLVRFFYIGVVQDEIDLRRMLQIVSLGVCEKLKHIQIYIQDEEINRNYWISVVNVLKEEFLDVMNLYDIILCFCVYKC